MLPVLADLLRYPEPAGWSDSPLRRLYLAPLKALVNDVARTLEGIWPTWPPFSRRERDSRGFRCGRATPRPAERRRLRDEPPDVLLTTPESLAVLLSQPACSALLANLAWVVVDEVHALAGNNAAPTWR